jgi:hypothetical protein
MPMRSVLLCTIPVVDSENKKVMSCPAVIGVNNATVLFALVPKIVDSFSTIAGAVREAIEHFSTLAWLGCKTNGVDVSCGVVVITGWPSCLSHNRLLMVQTPAVFGTVTLRILGVSTPSARLFTMTYTYGVAYRPVTHVTNGIRGRLGEAHWRYTQQ